MTMQDHLLKPIGHDKHGPKISNTKTLLVAAHRICHENLLGKRYKKMSNEIDEAENEVTKSLLRLSNTLDRLVDLESNVSTKSKSISGKVRDSANKLGDGLKKIEAQADFSKLENYVKLLERAELAMSSLAELEKSGKLDKILAAVK